MRDSCEVPTSTGCDTKHRAIERHLTPPRPKQQPQLLSLPGEHQSAFYDVFLREDHHRGRPFGMMGDAMGLSRAQIVTHASSGPQMLGGRYAGCQLLLSDACNVWSLQNVRNSL